MKTVRHSRVACFAVLLAFAACIAAPALAAQGGDVSSALAERKKVEPVGPWAYKRLQRLYEALEDERYDDALEALDEMKPNPKLNSHEKALMWQGYGYVYSSMDEHAKAADAFASCLAANGLGREATLQTRYNLAQLDLLVERYDDAIAQLQEWFAHARNPAPVAFYMMAMAYAQKQQYPEALRYAEGALEKAGDQPKESWLQMVSALRLEQKKYEQAVPILEKLVAEYPKKTYWVQLAAVYSQLGNYEKALATLELADQQHLLTQQTELMGLAQLYLYNQIPYRAAEVIERGLADETIAANAQVWQLLADSWLHARETDKALPPLRRAAKLSADGNAYFRLAQVQMERENWSAAREALQAALDKGKLISPGHAYLMLGIANANEQRWDDAERAFVAAQDYEQVGSAAKGWLKHLASERDLAEQTKHVARGRTAESTAARGGSTS